MLTVVFDGTEPVGRVEWFTAAWGRPETSSCWTLAGGLRPAWRGRGIGSAAQRMLANYLFVHTRAQRLQAYCDLANLAAHRVLEKAGFSREGVLRSAQWRDGGWHDVILYSCIRSDENS